VGISGLLVAAAIPMEIKPGEQPGKGTPMAKSANNLLEKGCLCRVFKEIEKKRVCEGERE
jgi:hypothetical protein